MTLLTFVLVVHGRLPRVSRPAWPSYSVARCRPASALGSLRAVSIALIAGAIMVSVSRRRRPSRWCSEVRALRVRSRQHDAGRDRADRRGGAAAVQSIATSASPTASATRRQLGLRGHRPAADAGHGAAWPCWWAGCSARSSSSPSGCRGCRASGRCPSWASPSSSSARGSWSGPPTAWSHGVNLDALLICIVAGYVVANQSRNRRKFLRFFNRAGPIIFIPFFTLTGAGLKLGVLWSRRCPSASSRR